MNNGYAVKVKSWDEVVTIGGYLSSCVFRGQNCANWGLKTKMERAGEQWKIPAEKVREREKITIYQFQRKAHLYNIQNPPEPNNLLEWAALIQHYGGPTRLLDVSFSYYIALFFSIEYSDKDAAVWAINTGKIAKSEHIEGPKEPNDSTIQECNQILNGTKSGEKIILVQPFRVNKRLSIQKGAFLFPQDVTKSFEEQLSKTLEIRTSFFNKKNQKLLHKKEWQKLLLSQITKIIIPKGCHSYFMRELSRMNISTETLFEGLDGFARSLHTLLLIYDRFATN